MLKIYGGDLSSPANKVRFTANALGLKYEYIQVKIREGANRTEEYLKINPFGKIPAIDDDGFVLFESDAICKYLASKEKSPLYPSELKARAVVDQWMDFITIHININVGKILYNRIFVNFTKEAVDERSMADGLKFLAKFLPVVDERLFKSHYLAGADLTLADIDLLSGLDPVEVAQIDISSYKNILRLRNELKQKSFYTQCYKEYGESLKQRV